jgi:2-keto-4-pentenoate hydratase/2-oxohepta-3-ene-1,7-dioic acid hydratase in catechol pathway
MRWIRYTFNGVTAYGIAENDSVIEVRGDPFKGYEQTAVRRKLSEVRIEVPVIPPTFYAAGRNYVAHMAASGKPVLAKPDIGYRATNALVAHDQPVVIPYDATERVVYEGELVAVIGRTCKRVSEEQALDYVLGYTIGNDVSERTWQSQDATFWRCKNTDTFKPMGPWIETDLDLDRLETIVRLNGEEQIRFKTNDMVFGVARFISTMSKYLTLHPGDVIWLGTDGTSPNIKHGDVVEIEITGLGTLRSPFVREASPGPQ